MKTNLKSLQKRLNKRHKVRKKLAKNCLVKRSKP